MNIIMTTKNGAKTISLIPGCIYYQYGPLFNFTNKTILQVSNLKILKSINLLISNHGNYLTISDNPL